MVRVQSLRGTGVLPVAGGELIGEGLRVWVDRTAAFQKVLSDVSVYLKPPCQRQGCVVLNCPALHPKPNLPSPDTLTLGQLRTVLLTDHLGALLRRQGMEEEVYCVLPEESDIIVFLRLLGIDWPTVPISWTNDEREENILEALQNSPYREREETDEGRRESKGKNTDGDKEEMLRVNLKRVFQEEQLPGYDPSLGSCTGETNNIDLLTWGLVVNVLKRHLVCGPMKTPGTHLSAAQYLHSVACWPTLLSRGFVCGWCCVESELTDSCFHTQVTLDVQREGSLSTKGPRGGVFVMYNCARLHTLFDSYQRGVEKGLYPEIPEGSQLEFSALKEEGEWLLLFDYLIPFSELLDQTRQPLGCDGGARVNLKTERICKFLVPLSKDFSSYYNRVHVLGEPLPHLFNQMFCRLQLLRALRELYHRALDTLHLPPIPQL
nr:DALR anticodon-binding domain-containing protein 3-like [Oncorhynchus nerka]